MNEYYGIASTPTDDFLAHYGVKGMKWGVRKAIERGSSKALGRQYRKAEKKLAKLENKANAQYQLDKAKVLGKSQAAAAVGGAISAGIAGARTASSIRRAMKYGSRYATVYLPVGAGIAAGHIITNQVRKHNARKLAGSGHDEAVRKANEFRQEMRKSFKGTEYGNKVGKMASGIAKRKRDRIKDTLGYYGDYSKTRMPNNRNANSRRRRK